MNQKLINSPSIHREGGFLSSISYTYNSTVGLPPRPPPSIFNAERCTHRTIWCYEPDARDEAEDFGDEYVEAADDRGSGGTDVTGAEDRGWVAALCDNMTTRMGSMDTMDMCNPVPPANNIYMTSQMREGSSTEIKNMWRTKVAWEASCLRMANSLRSDDHPGTRGNPQAHQGN